MSNFFFSLLSYSFLGYLGLLCILLLYKMWTNQIDLRQLLSDTQGGASMSRFQLLLFTLIALVGIFLFILDHKKLPDIPESMLTLLGISASTYAVGKGIAYSRPDMTTPAATAPAVPPPDGPK